MYIQFTDKELFTQLQCATLTKVKMGSHLYGCATENSDVDYLCIYAEGRHNLNSFAWEHHALQYKSDRFDYNFTTLQKFIRNLINGDSPHNYEVLFSEEFITSELSWLLEYREHFVNYNLIRAYLGLVKRDMKDFAKELHGIDKNLVTSEGYKKLSHAKRGFDTAVSMMVGNRYEFHVNGNSESVDYIKQIKLGQIDFSDVRRIQKWIDHNMELVRGQLNDMLNKRSINKIMNPEIAKKLDNEIMSFCESEVYKCKQTDYIDYKLYPYTAIENGVSY